MKENKKRENVNQKKGISLIVLVITIIVIVILAVAVILSIASNNPIDNATKAVAKSNMAEYESELSLYVAKQYAENQGNYDLSAINLVGKNVKKVISSLSESDTGNYAIVQGKLYEKSTNEDGTVVYKNSSNETIPEWLGDTALTENMKEFLNAFDKRQNELEESSRLLYNIGYITGIEPGTSVEELKGKLGYENIYIKSSSATLEDDSIKENDDKVATGDQICIKIGESNNKYELLAKVIIYGDTTCRGIITADNAGTIYKFLNGNINEIKTLEQKISADVNHDGIISSADASLIYNQVGGVQSINQKVLATISTIE